MATILVTGGTGALGRQLVPRLRAAGHDVRVLSRRGADSAAGGQRPGGAASAAGAGWPAGAASAAGVGWAAGAGWAVGDLVTGAGLGEALRDVQTVVHCASDLRRPRHDLPAASQLITAARAAGGPHLVYVSIVGVDQLPLGYYRIKLEIERLVAGSGLPWTVLRVTQFHDLLCYIFQLAATLPVLMVPAGVSFQPVDPGDVAARLTELAGGPAAGRAADFGGPLVQDTAELAGAWLRAAGRRRRVVPVPLPGRAMRGFAAGAHLAPDHADARVSFADFLREHVSPAVRSRRYGRLR